LNERWERHIENGKKARLTELRNETEREEEKRNSVESVWVGRGRTFELVVGKDGLPVKLEKGALSLLYSAEWALKLSRSRNPQARSGCRMLRMRVEEQRTLDKKVGNFR